MGDAMVQPEGSVAMLPGDSAAAGEGAGGRPLQLRLGIAVAIVALMWVARTLPGWLAPETFLQFLSVPFAPVVALAALAVWWLAGTNLPWRNKWITLLPAVVCGINAALMKHPSAILAIFYAALPLLATGWVLWLLATRRWAWRGRQLGLIALGVLVWIPFLLLRIDGVDGSFGAELSWRWSPTAEERFLSERSAEGSATSGGAGEPLRAEEGDWLEYRGSTRDGVLRGVTIATDWEQRPPKLIWKQRIGPGWSAFTVVGKRLFTQEQRGEDECVTCYDADTGRELWVHQDRSRFYEVIAGAGPRATPTFAAGKLYVTGASGLVTCLDARDGAVQWQYDLRGPDVGGVVPEWGFSASPLVVGGVVITYAGAPGKTLAAFDAASGQLKWTAGTPDGKLDKSYCSPQLFSVDGRQQVLLTTFRGLAAYEPETGKLAWEHEWPIGMDGFRVVQPLQVAENEFLVGSSFGLGTRRVRLAGDATEALWTSKQIKPYYNDYVLSDGHLYGFDVEIFTCIDVADGKRKWKGGRYGHGQVVSLADQGLLLVLSESGELVVLKATPEGHQELARVAVLEGKTWTPPVIAHGRLYVRNAEQAACYELPAP